MCCTSGSSTADTDADSQETAGDVEEAAGGGMVFSKGWRNGATNGSYDLGFRVCVCSVLRRGSLSFMGRT